jgi:hypothetical protein
MRFALTLHDRHLAAANPAPRIALFGEGRAIDLGGGGF